MNTKLKPMLIAALRKMPLVQKFVAAVVCLILVIMIAVNSLVLTSQRSALRTEMENSHLLMMRNLAKDVVEPLMVLDPLRLDEQMQVSAQSPGVVFIAVLDSTNRIVAHTDRKQLGMIWSASAQNASSVSTDTLSIDVRQLWVPVKVGNEQIGMITAGISSTRIEGLLDENLGHLKRTLIGITIGMLMLGIGGAWLLARFLTTPMRQLQERMNQVQSGNLIPIAEYKEPRCWELLGCEEMNCPARAHQGRCWTLAQTACSDIHPATWSDAQNRCRSCVVYREICGDEVGELAETFNEMVRRLRESLNELERTTQEKARLEKLSALGEMSMTVAHEIKNPLNAIRGAVAYLQNNFQGEVLREFLGIIEAETKRLNEIVTNYLVFSRPAPLRKERADLNRALADVVNLMRQEVSEDNKEIVLQTDDALPHFRFDVHQMKQAFLNLLVNAADATRPGDTITVRTIARDGMADVMIKDTGAGIPGAVLTEIFRPFYTTKTHGSGLGLPCVERIIRDHGGDIKVVSEPGVGTEFLVSIPVGGLDD
jgi:signal transduction histidine kinase